MLVDYAGQHVQHMQKALTQMNVKLQHVISDITGKTGMDIIEATVGGERDPRKLARLRDPRTRADEENIAKSLRGHRRDEHVFELTQALELYRTYQAKIAECDREIEAQLEQFDDRSDREPPAPASNGKKRNQKNAPRFDVQSHLYRMTGVDLTRIDGVDGLTALKAISEAGTDLTRWPSARHFASWLGLSPHYFRFQVDHIVALADDGRMEERNLQVLCGYCNRVKGTKGKDGYRLKMAGGQRGHGYDGGREAGDAHWQAAGPLPPRGAARRGLHYR